MTTEPLPAAAEAGHLTRALRDCGALADGQVREVVVASARTTVLSRITRLSLAYEGDAAGAPASLILKTGHPDRAGKGWNGGRREVAFYTQAAPAMPAGVVPRCFDASWNAETTAWHLLLEDLTDTHEIATTWPLPPVRAQCETIMDAMARCHAAMWDHPALGTTVGEWEDAGGMDASMRRLAEQVGRFADTLDDRLPRERRDLYERLIDAAPRLAARYHAHRDATIVHGDAHVWNCFLPRNGDAGDARLFDWDAWRIDVAADDLAYMMAMHWYPDRRRQLEQPLLDRYHATLVAQGVTGYDRRALADDYRLSALWLIAKPVWQAAHGIPPVIWWNNLERIMLAVDDLDCRALLA